MTEKFLPGDPSKTTRYYVLWRDGGGRRRFNSVLITEGYSTVDDIPKILGILDGGQCTEVISYYKTRML